jgi:photosystem II stability/assembly factor-like uncharacterized protein
MNNRRNIRASARLYTAVLSGAVLFVLLRFSGMVQARASSSEPYLWRNVVIGGGGFVTGIVPHPRQPGLMYARTDVGGAYRWDDPAQRWIPLTDWIGMADVDLTGCESIAVDPNDPERVYLAVGTYSRGNAAILRSADQGRTFQRTDVPFKMGGNEAGRFNGERLAVDPNEGRILFFGSRRDGLWKSPDRGATWQKVDGFPGVSLREASLTETTDSRPWFGFNQQPVGIVCVLFDPSGSRPGQPTPALYAAVSLTETNLYCSTNGGVTWRAVANQPMGLRPNHLVRSPSDGMLYLSYGKEPGPNTLTDGAVWKFSPNNGAWTDITPVRPKDADQPFGYGCVAVDAQHPSTLMATTFAHWSPHDEIFRSTNGGASWTQLWDDHTQWDHSRAPYTRTRTPHWMGTMAINPFSSDRVWFTTGYGIWGCTNATVADAGKSTRWLFLDEGLEETVPLALISPPQGAHLLSGVGDIDGFRHDDLDQSPVEGTFSGQRYGNTEDLALAGNKPDAIVRTGTGGGRGTNRIVRASISEDGGKTWKMLAGEPPNSSGAGTIAISADGKTIVWTPRRSAPCWSADRGTNWTACAGLSTGTRVVADPVNPARFYAYDAHAGRVLISANGAASFISTPATFLAAENFGDGGASLSATPGRESDLWLAFRSHGLYHSSDAGATFTKLDAVQEAYSLGFGQAAPGQKYPALYLIGKADNLQALFRSDDAGESWVRINDGQHQYGWINHVTGDPRIYGRVYFATGGRGIIYGDLKPIQK